MENHLHDGRRLNAPHYKVAIIGAGFCGTMVAVNLAQMAPDMPIALIERNADVGPGLAYGTPDPDHLLNVRGGNMGAFAGQADHFWKWLSKHPGTGATPNSFVQRRVYAQYLKEILAEARAAHSGVQVLNRHIVDIRRTNERFEIVAKDGQTIIADFVVLALGNFPPDRLSNDAEVIDPYAPATWKQLSEPGDILIVGTGLTSLDLVVTLSRTKKDGIIRLLSRRGLLPREHTAPGSHTLKWQPPHPKTVVGLLRAIRKEIATHPDVPWQNIIDSFRTPTQLIWQSLDQTEKRRFLRHLRPYWDSHRHRCAPEIMEFYRTLERDGRMRLHAGSIIAQTRGGQGWKVTWHPRGKKSDETFFVRQIVRCTGPQNDFRKLPDELVQNLLKSGLIAPDPLALGISTNLSFQATDATGKNVSNLYTLGTVLRGRLYESVAVPELREQAKAIAEQIAAA